METLSQGAQGVVDKRALLMEDSHKALTHSEARLRGSPLRSCPRVPFQEFPYFCFDVYRLLEFVRCLIK